MAWVVLFHSIVFLTFWFTNLSFQKAVNDFLADTTGLKLDFLLVFIIFSLVVALWSGVRLALRAHVKKTGPAWLYTGVGIFYFAFFYGSFIVLFIKNPVQVARLGQMILYFRILIDIALTCLVAWGVRMRLSMATVKWDKGFLVGGLILFWLIPVIWIPGNVYRGPLPGKPLLIAHRGASQLAPENTLSSMQRAAELGVYGVETDIIVSRDGILFLMHDSTLARTTNVAQIFPTRINAPANSFTWNELEQLSAGQWFVGQSLYPNEPIPTLTEMLQVVHDKDLHFIYDLSIPSADHPYASQVLDMCLDEIKAAGVASYMWVLTEPDEIAHVRSVLPEAVLASGLDYEKKLPSPQSLVAEGYQLVNSEYGLSDGMIHAYKQAGLWVNLWTVDEPWQYSRLWLVGADSVTSNIVQILISMPRPTMAMPYSLYLVVWIAVGLISAAIVIVKRKV
jgi:glycerophosphoryl diester phosphodiesterase